jgi:hypothetical protein
METGPGADRPTPAARLLGLATGYYVSCALHTAARLGVADELAGGARDCGSLAAATGADADALRRVLRLLVGAGVLREEPDDRFALTEVGECLRTDAPDGLRDVVLQFAGTWQQRSWSALEHTVRTSQPGFEREFGTDVFGYLGAHPAEAAVFHRAMTFFASRTSDAVAEAYDFGRFRILADVGGGHGALLATLLRAHPRLRGVLVDLPEVVAGAGERLAAAGVADRCAVVGGDFFAEVPAGADAYLLKSVVHDWDDERAAAILRNCRRAMPADGTLLLVEMVYPTGFTDSLTDLWVAGSDVNMMLHAGGRERTLDEWAALLARAGLELTGAVPVRPRWSGLALNSVIEARPLRSRGSPDVSARPGSG